METTGNERVRRSFLMADVVESCVISRRAFEHIPWFFAPTLFFSKGCSSQNGAFFVRGCGQGSSAEAIGTPTGRKAQRVGQAECGGGVKTKQRRPGQRRFSTR